MGTQTITTTLVDTNKRPKDRPSLKGLVNLIDSCLTISGRHDPHRSETLWKFLRLKVNLRLLSRIFGKRPSPETLYGNRISFLDYGALVFLFEEIFVHRDYEFVARRPDPLIIDCGSNIGMSVFFFKHLYPDSKIIAFEPDDEAFAVLRANCQQNRWSGVQIHNKALGSSPQIVDFFYDPGRPGSPLMSTVKDRLAKATKKVECVQLSRFINEPVDFLKMDVEGAELLVLSELAREQKLSLIEQMVIEYHHHVSPGEDHLSELFSLLETNGFACQLSAPNRRPFRSGAFQDILIYAYRK